MSTGARFPLISAGVGAVPALVAVVWLESRDGFFGVIEGMIGVAVLVLVPLALALWIVEGELGGNLGRVVTWVQPPAAVAVLASLALRPGPVSAALTLPWAALTLLFGWAALQRGGRVGLGGISGLAAKAALVLPVVGAGHLAASRAGLAPLGIQEPILLLTAMHFHFTGIAFPLHASMLLRRRGGSKWAATAVATGVGLAAIPLIAAGFLMPSKELRLAGTVLLAAAVVVIAIGLMLRARQCDVLSGGLLAIAGVSALVGMVLAVAYSLGDAGWLRGPSIPWMTYSHGLLNGLGFAVLGLAGWALTAVRGAGR